MSLVPNTSEPSIQGRDFIAKTLFCITFLTSTNKCLSFTLFYAG